MNSLETSGEIAHRPLKVRVDPALSVIVFKLDQHVIMQKLIETKVIRIDQVRARLLIHPHYSYSFSVETEV